MFVEYVPVTPGFRRSSSPEVKTSFWAGSPPTFRRATSYLLWWVGFLKWLQ